MGPMAGNGDAAFRRVCRECGAQVAVTEMVSAKATYFKDKKTEFLARISEAERPCVLQIFGSEAETMRFAARTLTEKFRPDGLDINMGCPAPKIFSNGDGSALLLDLKKAEQLVAAVRKSTDVPLSVKFRLGVQMGQNVAVEAAQRFEAAGADYLCVHGRYREQYYSGSADRKSIADVKRAVKIPVIANGDIDGVESYLDMLSVTGADGVMIARGALGNPYLFTQIAAYRDRGEILPPQPLRDRLALSIRQMNYCIEDKGEALAMREMRKHFMWYVKGIRGAAAVKAKCAAITTPQQWLEIVQQLCEKE